MSGSGAEGGVSSAASAAGGRGAPKWARAGSWVVGVVLIALAGWAVARSGVRVTGLWDAVRNAGAGRLALLFGLIALTPVCSSVMFWVLTRRYAAVGFVENTALTVGSWLLNYVPAAPGLVGRLAYLKVVRGVPVGQGARVVIWANVLSLISAAGLLLTLGAGALVTREGVWLGLISAVPAGLIGGFAWYARVKRPKPDPEVWRIVAGLGVRWVELLVWAGRYWVVFEIAGTPIGWGGAVALAGIAGVAVLFPIAPNGLGVREWAVGLVLPVLPAGLAYSVGLTTSAGLSAELLHRGCEVVVAVPMGLAGLAFLWGRLRRSRGAGGAVG